MVKSRHGPRPVIYDANFRICQTRDSTMDST